MFNTPSADDLRNRDDTRTWTMSATSANNDPDRPERPSQETAPDPQARPADQNREDPPRWNLTTEQARRLAEVLLGDHGS